MRTGLKALILTLFIAIPSLAATVAGVTMDDHATVNGKSLVLNGAGLRSKFFIKVYVGGLYVPAKQASAASLLAADSERRMVMHFLYGVSKEQMCDAWKEGLEDNVKNAGGEVRASFTTLCTWMEAIPKGQELVLTYVPGTGTAVEINGKAKGTLAGKATSDAILSTWIGPKPGPGDDFKAAILGK